MPKKLRFATIGTSAITERFLDALSKMANACYAGCYSRSIDSSRKFAKTHGAKLVFDNLDSLAASNEIDAVYIASPNALHAPQAKQMISSGKHVLVEKTLASNAYEAAAVLSCAQANDVVAMEAMRNLYDPGFSVVEHTIADLGDVYSATFRFSKISSRISRLQLGQRVNVFDPRLSEGALMDIGVYTVEPAIALFGVPDRVLVAAVTSNVPGEPADSPSQVIDLSGEILFDYGNKVINLSYGKIYDNVIASEISGSKGTLSIDALPNFSGLHFVRHENRGMIYDTEDGARQDLEVNTPDNDMVCELECFIDAVCGKTEACKLVSRFHQTTLDALAVMDEARGQLGIRFPADEPFKI